jgi:hypothetical protein
MFQKQEDKRIKNEKKGEILGQWALFPQVIAHGMPSFFLPFFNRDRMFLTDLITIPKTIIGTERDNTLLRRIMDTTPFESMKIQVKRIHEPHGAYKQAFIMEPT